MKPLPREQKKQYALIVRAPVGRSSSLWKKARMAGTLKFFWSFKDVHVIMRMTLEGIINLNSIFTVQSCSKHMP
jgi:hypothetical protein